jgi:hypothetical protein
MISELDVWHAAEQMRKLYGADAVIHAAMRADSCFRQADIQSCSSELLSFKFNGITISWHPGGAAVKGTAFPKMEFYFHFWEYASRFAHDCHRTRSCKRVLCQAGQP